MAVKGDNVSSFKRFLNSKEYNYFLFGPRGVGKTTFLKNSFPDALYIDLLNPVNFRNYKAHPERLIEIVKAQREKIVIIDEVQKIPELLDVVHHLIEEDKKYRFVLSGSNPRKIIRKGFNLLSGRLKLKKLHPFMGSELKDEFDYKKSLRYGLIPLIYFSENPLDTLDAYISLYLQEEIIQEGIIRNSGDFMRFLEVISFSQASLLNISSIARESNVKRKTVYNYMDILFDLLIAFTIPVFTKRAKRALVMNRKFYFFDSGVFNAIRPKGIIDSIEEIEGSVIEGIVAQHLKSWIDYSDNKYELFFWRTRSGVEVDFIIYGEKMFYAVEVKRKERITKNDLKSLKIFRQDFPEAKLLLLYNGNEELLIDDIFCMPVEKFLRVLTPDKFPL